MQRLTGRHRAEDVQDIPVRLLVLIGMICTTAVLALMTVTGHAEVIGQIASAAFLCSSYVIVKRIRQLPK